MAEETYSQQVLTQFCEIRKEIYKIRYKKNLKAQDRALEDSIKAAAAEKTKSAEIAAVDKAKAAELQRTHKLLRSS